MMEADSSGPIVGRGVNRINLWGNVMVKDTHQDNDHQCRRRAVCRTLIVEKGITEGTFLSVKMNGGTWRILLEMYLAQMGGKPVYFDWLCMVCNEPRSTAHRWITDLIRQGVIVRRRDGVDHRRSTLLITEASLEKVERIIDKIIKESILAETT